MGSGVMTTSTMAAAVVVVLWVAVSVDVGWCSDDGMMENAKGRMNMAARNVEVKAKEMKQKAAEAMRNVKEKAGSWYRRAYGTFSKDARENIKGRASKTSDTMKQAAYGASRYACGMNVDEAVNKACGTVGDIKDFNSDQVIRMASDRASDAREKVAGAMDYGKYKAANAYDDANDLASYWVGDSRDAMAEGMNYGRSRLTNAYDEAKQKLGRDTNMASDRASDAREKVAGAMDCGKYKAANAYDDADNMASYWLGDSRDAMAEGMNYGRSRLTNARDEAKQKLGRDTNMASGRASDAREKVAGAMDCGKYKAANAYDDADNMASYWLGDSRDAMAEGMNYGRSRLTNAYDEAKQKLGRDANMASEKLGDAEEEMTEAMEHGKERSAQVHDEAKQQFDKAKDAIADAMGYERWDKMDVSDEAIKKVCEVYCTAKETMKVQGKSKYEAAKERLSKATGDLGAKMRNERAVDMYDEAEQKMGMASDVASEKASKGKEAMQLGAMGCEEMNAFDEAVNNVREAYRLAKEERTFRGRSKYEAAKERMWKATGGCWGEDAGVYCR
ncbi:embryonic protein DC-8 [Manihot esculenta]|uniref:Uncharacterized protein n=3 Tax=Manihot esculenta TaxID=3983 RepID=A0A2C9WKF2_MANES|nr:embryonic protein DC-8 [Manihot esculenta]XP_043814183.1 embryonic protein DC-8 [Manihot esculenta]KAG8662698.1 hypothetical protein MANES_01G135700v8 [Manihot esculenta]OAY60745.1 hypothetical protein MANES_01G135700v8 [Manihot esculenta]